MLKSYRGFCIFLITDNLYFRLFGLELSAGLQKVRNKLLGQGHFWPFAPRQLLEVIFCLISSFQLNLANNYYIRVKLEIDVKSIGGWANQTFYSAAKMPNFQFSRRANWRAGQENYCESKQTYYSCSLDKAFHLPDEFQAKLFFTRN